MDKVKFTEEQVQGCQQFEINEVQKSVKTVPWPKYYVLFQNNFPLPFLVFKRLDRNDYFAGEKVCFDKIQPDSASYTYTQCT